MISCELQTMCDIIDWNNDEVYKQSIDYQRMENQFDVLWLDIDAMELGQATLPQHGHQLTYPIGYNYDGSYRQ